MDREEINLQEIWNLRLTVGNPIKKYSLQDIHSYRIRKSRQMSRSTRLIIVFDIIYKLVSLMGMILLLVTRVIQTPYLVVIWLLIIATVVLIAFEYSLIKKVRSIRESDAIVETLSNKLYYLRTSHKVFIFLSALSNPIFVTIAFVWYYAIKYGQIGMTAPFEDPVIYGFILLSFAISYFSQVPIHRRQVNDLKETVMDIDNTKVTNLKIAEAREHRIKVLILYSILFLIGICLFFTVLFNHQ